MCDITYTSLVLNSAGTQLTLKGTAPDCPSGIRVTAAPFSPSISVPVDAVDFTWTATFTVGAAELAYLKERCGQRVNVDAFCANDDGCRVTDAIILQCEEDPPPPKDNCCAMICCMVFKLLFLLGLGFALLGFIFEMCPSGICVRETDILLGFKIWGFLLAFVGLLFWVVLCRPKRCDWVAALWQFFILDGLLMIYAGLSPECWTLLFIGVGAFAFGLMIYFGWVRACRVDLCRKLSEWAGLFLIPVNALLALITILTSCGSASNVRPMILLALVFLFQLWLLAMLKKNKCIKC